MRRGWGPRQECPRGCGRCALRMRRSSCLAGFLAAAGLLAASRAPAELIVFEDGHVVKASGYVLLSEELEIRLPGGGSYRVDLSRVERIVDDEVVVDTVVVEGDGLRAGVSYDLSYKDGRKPLFGSDFDGLIEREARTQNIDASFVSALIRAESNYEPRAVSRKGARGLMQLMPATALRLSVRKPLDPASNIRGGVRYLRELVDRFGPHPELVLAAYNAGEGAVGRWLRDPERRNLELDELIESIPYDETRGYTKRVLASYFAYAWLYAERPADRVPSLPLALGLALPRRK